MVVAAALVIVIIVILIVMVMAFALRIVTLAVVVMVVMMVCFLVLLAKLAHHLFGHGSFRLHSRQDDLTVDLIPRCGNDGRLCIMLAKQRHQLVQFLL